MKKRLQHLLIIRLSAMGDVAMCVPALQALRSVNPELKITVLTRSFFKPFFRDIENINFITPNFDTTHKGFAGVFRLAREVQALKVTHVADLHNIIRTKLLCKFLKLCGMKVRIIDKGREERGLMTRKFRKVVTPLRHTIDRYCDVFKSLGLDVAIPEPVQKMKLPIPESIYLKVGDKFNETWIGVAPFAQHKGKIYPSQSMGELIKILSEKYDKVFIFGGGPYERDFSECMEQRYAGVVSVIGRLNLSEELDLISSLDVMISMDSAAMHMSTLVGTTVVSVWGATHPYVGFMGFGQDISNAVQLDLPCRPCSVYGNKPCLFNDYHCMENITPEMISSAVERALLSAVSK